jgi:hypothetical protein
VLQPVVRPFSRARPRKQNDGKSIMTVYRCQGQAAFCRGKVEMSYRWQSRNVVFCLGRSGASVILRVPVKRRRALVATNPIEE